MNATAPRVALIGGVESSAVALEELIASEVTMCGVAGLAKREGATVSGYVDLGPAARAAGVPFVAFNSVREETLVGQLRAWKPTHLFVVGLSQLLDHSLLSIASQAAIGFHPTALPRGRGRAPIAWLTADGAGGAATFFLIDQGVDSGPIVAQEPFTIPERANAADVADALYAAMRTALRRLVRDLPRLPAGALPQDHASATYFGRRAPEDGWIDWHRDAESIERLVRMSSRPHPGAFTYLNDTRLTLWQAVVAQRRDLRGVVGRILAVEDRRFVVQAGSGLLEVIDWQSEGQSPQEPRVGNRLGLLVEPEVVALRQRVVALEHLVQDLVKRQGAT